MSATRAKLVLADGLAFEGEAFGAEGERIGEVVFNTSMFGYQEILTDPSYVGQILTMTNPEIGNVGVNPEDDEHARVHPVGFVVRNLTREPSSWRATGDLSSYLAKHGVVGIAGIDTRKLVRHLRTVGAQMGVISTEGLSDAALQERAKKAPGMEGQDLASGISCKQAYVWPDGSGDPLREGKGAPPAQKFHVVAYDFGLKKAMIRLLVDRGCKVTVVPAHTTAAEALAFKPDGIFLTNGPGDPAAVKGVDKEVAALLGKVPLMGICLGHQLLALAIGARTYKLKFGHRGGNQPVKDLATGKVDITSQNHGFAVDDKTLGARATVTHVNLNDGTVEGIEVTGARAFSVQYHPEASPGPHDARPLFDRFIGMMEQAR